MIGLSNMNLHEQIKKDLMSLIDNGEWGPGARLPSERELAKRYGVSRVTVRQSISELIMEGLLVRKQGSGTYIKTRVIEQPMARLCGIVEELMQQHIEVSIEVLEREYYSYSAGQSYLWEKLDLPREESVYKVKRKLGADGRPLLLDYNFVPAEIGRKFETLDANKDVFFQALSHFGYEIGYAQQSVSAKIATASQARQLEMKPGSAVLDVERTTFTNQGIPLLFTRVAFVGDQYSYKIMLKRDI